MPSPSRMFARISRSNSASYSANMEDSLLAADNKPDDDAHLLTDKPPCTCTCVAAVAMLAAVVFVAGVLVGHAAGHRLPQAATAGPAPPPVPPPPPPLPKFSCSTTDGKCSVSPGGSFNSSASCQAGCKTCKDDNAAIAPYVHGLSCGSGVSVCQCLKAKDECSAITGNSKLKQLKVAKVWGSNKTVTNVFVCLFVLLRMYVGQPSSASVLVACPASLILY